MTKLIYDFWLSKSQENCTLLFPSLFTKILIPELSLFNIFTSTILPFPKIKG